MERISYFVFNNMRDAEYHYKNLVMLLEEKGIKELKYNKKEKSIIFPKKVKRKENFIKNILIKLNILQPTYIDDNLKIIFKSKDSNFVGIHPAKKIEFYTYKDLDSAYLIDTIRILY